MKIQALRLYSRLEAKEASAKEAEIPNKGVTEEGLKTFLQKNPDFLAAFLHVKPELLGAE